MKQVDATRCSTYPACAMFSSIVNTILLPVRLVFRHETVNKLGLRSMRDERNNMVKKHAKGRLLDIGCGSNQLVRSYGHESVGIDVYDFGGVALLVKDSANLPFDDASFDTVSFVFFFQAEDGIRDWSVTGVQTCALPISHVFFPSRRRHTRLVSDWSSDV